MTAAIEIRDARHDDVAAITTIYNQLIASTTIEWTETPHTESERTNWLKHNVAESNPVLVAVLGDQVVGVASYDDFRDSAKWPGYRFTVEHSVHVQQGLWGHGVGRALMQVLMQRARAAGKHVMIGAVDADNTGSIRFHERLGFVEVGRLPETGYKLGRRLGLVLLQQVL